MCSILSKILCGEEHHAVPENQLLTHWFLPFPSYVSLSWRVCVENARQNQRMLQNHDEKRISTGYVALGRYRSSEGLDCMDTESTLECVDDERSTFETRNEIFEIVFKLNTCDIIKCIELQSSST